MSLKKTFQNIFKNKPLLQLLLFINCLIFLFLLPLFSNLPFWVPKLFSSVLIILSLLALEKGTKYIFFTGFLAIIFSWLTKFIDHFFLSSFSELISYVFLLWMVSSLITQIMRLREVTTYHLLEAVNGYLLLGILFTSFVLFLNQHYPNSFKGPQAHLVREDLLYYTMITMTTTGYGDILPRTSAAKELAVMIAISGQFYVAIIVAVLVGKYSNKR